MIGRCDPTSLILTTQTLAPSRRAQHRLSVAQRESHSSLNGRVEVLLGSPSAERLSEVWTPVRTKCYERWSNSS